jgi:hypothetical protein
MKQRVISFILAMGFMLSVLTIIVFAAVPTSADRNTITDNPVATFSEDYIPSETTSPTVATTAPTEATSPKEEVITLDTVEFKRVEPTTYEEAASLLEEVTTRQTLAESIYKDLITFGYADNHPAVVMVKADIENAKIEVKYYQEQYVILEEKHKWEVRAAEYPVATQVWLYMKNEFGWNDIVCAGVIGNMMAECGGCWTSDLNWQSSSSSGYGLIQWVGNRRKELFSKYGNNPSVEDQLNFMKDELYGTNGVTKQVNEEQFNKIMNASSPESCAFAFATYFERCGECHRAPRRGYARRAYEYFVG